MGLMSRLYRLCKADMHGVMDQLEDKQLLLKQYMREMQDDLRMKEACLTTSGEAIRRLEEECGRLHDTLQQLESDLDLAIGNQKDDIARVLIRKRQTVSNGADQLEQRLQGMRRERAELEETFERQRRQLEQMKVKIAGYCRIGASDPCGALEGLDGDHPVWAAPTDEEIELELLQRKQARQRGDGS